MLINFRLITGESTAVEVDPEQSVLDLKSVLARELALSDSNMRLIYKGRDLLDDTVVSSIDMQPQDFIVILQAKSDPAPRPPPPAAPIPPPRPVAPRPPEPPATDPFLSPSAQPLPTFGLPPTTLTVPTEDPPNMQELVASLLELGFPKEDCEEALRYCAFETEDAADCLLAGRLGIVRERFLQAIGGPEFFTTVDSLLGPGGGKTRFPPIDTLDRRDSAMIGGGPMTIGGGPMAMKGGGPVSRDRESMGFFTTEEQGKIAALEQLGFDREIVVQALTACEMDENMAANCLLSGTTR
jgi:hypothetical protein